MKTIKLCDIKIRDDFMQTKPSVKKVNKALRYIERFNKIDKPIILNDGVLVDSYSRYLAAVIKGMREVPCVELQEMNYIVGKFDNSNKEYVWKNDRNVNVKVGDKVLVESRNVNKSKTKQLYVNVVDIFLSDSLELYNKHRRVIKK